MKLSDLSWLITLYERPEGVSIREYMAMHLAALTPSSLDVAAIEEKNKRDFLIKNMEDAIDGEGYRFDGKRLFDLQVALNERVVSNEAVILPDIFFRGNPAGLKKNEEPWLLHLFKFPRIEGYSYNFGFIVAHTPLFQGSSEFGKFYFPGLAIDRRIFEVLKRTWDHKRDQNTQRGSGFEALLVSFFSCLREITVKGSHDYVHHLIYDQFMPGRNELDFTTKHSPMARHPYLHNRINSCFNRGALTRLSNSNFLEAYSFLVNTQSHAHGYSLNPSSITTDLEAAAKGIESLALIKAFIAESQCEEVAQKIAIYFSLTLLNFLFFRISPNRHETWDILREPVEKLALPPYQLSSGTILDHSFNTMHHRLAGQLSNAFSWTHRYQEVGDYLAKTASGYGKEMGLVANEIDKREGGYVSAVLNHLDKLRKDSNQSR